VATEQHWRDEKREGELGRYGERGRARQKREERAGKRQEYRVRRSDAACQRGQDPSREDHAQECLEFPHIVMSAVFPTTENVKVLVPSLYSDLREAISMEKRCFTSGSVTTPYRSHSRRDLTRSSGQLAIATWDVPQRHP